MSKNWQVLNTIEDALVLCKERIALYRRDMDKDEKERLASTILPFSFSDHFEEWEEKFPIVDEIEALASDLEWSNALDIDDGWEKLRARHPGARSPSPRKILATSLS